MADWKFARRRDRCGACAAAFDEGSRHVSLLSLRGEDLGREDLCLACWGSRAAGDEIFFWFTRQRSERRGLSLDLAALEQLFLRLEGREEERMLEVRYVLCLLLMRKRRLKLLRVAREPREALVVRRPRREEEIAVVVFDFAPERLEDLQRELLSLFEGAEPEPPEGAGSADGEGPAAAREPASSGMPG
jgi:hypothetical protein